jgi:cell division protein FtsQ
VARKSSSTALQEELYPAPGSREHDSRDSYAYERAALAREHFDDSRVVDLEAEQESPFLRGQKRVSVRRGSLPKKTANGLKWAALALVVLGILGAFGAGLYRYGKHSWRFRIDSSDQIEVANAQHVTRAQIMDVMGGDIGRNIFFVPLAERQQQLEQIPWVESASVMRFVPNRLRIEIHERTPVAFARIGSHISLIDAGGNLMELASGPKHTGTPSTPGSGVMGWKYSFPVITGMSANEPISTRAARMKDYNELMRQLDSGGARYSQDISEVDLSDSEDVKVMTADSSGGVLVHLGNGNYLQRYKIYITHVEAWRQQFEKLDSVDLRYDSQIIVNPDLQGIARQPALTPAAAKAALAAGVRNAAIVNYEKYVTHPGPAASAAKPVQPKSKEGLKVASKAGPKAAAKATAHRATPKAKTKGKALIAKNSPPHPPATTQKPAARAGVAPAQPPAAKTTRPTPATSAPATTVAAKQQKPSAAIPKEKPQN